MLSTVSNFFLSLSYLLCHCIYCALFFWYSKALVDRDLTVLSQSCLCNCLSLCIKDLHKVASQVSPFTMTLSLFYPCGTERQRGEKSGREIMYYTFYFFNICDWEIYRDIQKLEREGKPMKDTRYKQSLTYLNPNLEKG